MVEGTKSNEINKMGGSKGVEHDANEASEQEDDGVLRQYPRMRSQLRGYPNGPKRGENDGF